MRAEKDQIRAGFAAATRDLEVSISKLKEKTSIHATDISKKIQLIERLKQERNNKMRRSNRVSCASARPATNCM